MHLLVNVLCFVAGIGLTITALLCWTWYLGVQERVRHAETSKKDMEDVIKQAEEQQKAAAEALQNTLADLIARRTPNKQPNAPAVSAEQNVSASVKDRLRKAVEITGRQARIDVRQGPDFVMQHNELELEKLSILKTILADGFDPVITIRYSSGEQETLLSTYVQSISKGLA
jgi:hypothetical protein